MRKNAIYFKNFRDVIQILFKSGIFLQIPGLSFYTKTGRIEDDSFESLYKLYERKGNHVVLSWNYLYAGFVVWALVVGASVLVYRRTDDFKNSKIDLCMYCIKKLINE